jgi:hypothetical protein
MNWMASSRTSASGLALVLFALAAAGDCAANPPRPQLLYADDFIDTGNWILEAEEPARVVARDSAIDIDAPAGVTLWFKHGLSGPVAIEFVATAVAAGGPHDGAGDLEVFWMATNRDGSAPASQSRGGKITAYNDLRAYYVALRGNRDGTTRFRRYTGDPEANPWQPEHDLSHPDALLVPNRSQRIMLLASGSRIEYRRNDRALFTFEDAAPYAFGWFALHTTRGHLRIESLRIWRMPARDTNP